MIKSNQRFFNVLLVFFDMTFVGFTFALAWIIRFRTSVFNHENFHMDFRTYFSFVLVVIPLTVFFHNFFGLYQAQRNRGILREIGGIIKSNLSVFLGMLAILFALKQINFPRLTLGIFMILNILAGITERGSARLVLRHFRSKGYNLKHVLIVGTGSAAKSFLEKIKLHSYLGYNVVGFLEDKETKTKKKSNLKVIGHIQDIDNIIKSKGIDEIIIALELEQYGKLAGIIQSCEKNGVKAQIIPAYYKYIPAKPYIDQIDDLHLVNIRYVPLDDAFNKLLKRSFDIFFSMFGILLTSPIWLLAAILVKATSPGPVLFAQERIGLDRQPFMMYKFRSMRVQEKGDEIKKWTTKNDPRKTRIGSILRKTSIDELPQFLNVLRGDMSLIGPRPERPFFVDKFREEIPKYMVKHHVRPGITGLAQVKGFRGDTSIEGRIKWDIYYIENWTIWMDIKIIFMTIFNGFVHKNAY